MATTTTGAAPITAHIPAGYHPEDAFSAVQFMGADEFADRAEYQLKRSCGVYQWIALDLNTGALFFGDTGWALWQEVSRLVPGYLRGFANDETIPANGVIAHLLPSKTYDVATKSWIPQMLEDVELHELAVRVLPLAQEVVATIHRIGPRAELEWSARAETAWRSLCEATEWEARDGRKVFRHPDAELRPVPDYAYEVLDVIERWPQFVDPSWAGASDAELDRVAALNPGYGFGGVLHAMRQIAGYDNGFLEGTPWEGGSPYGQRHALRVYRERAAAGRTPVDAESWLTGDEHGRAVLDAVLSATSVADLDDARLGELGDRLQNLAAARQLRLTGLADYLTCRRAAARQAVEQDLSRDGAEAQRLAAELKEARTRRNAALARVIGWNDGRSERQLGALAHVSHTAVIDLRAKLGADEDGEEAS